MIAFAVPVFVGAFLLFQVQPIIARCILPWFGGTPAVWTTCMLFFQLLLLGGYAYAHGLVGRLRPREQAFGQALVLVAALAALGLQWQHWGGPLAPDASWKPESVAAPVWQILRLLSVAVGLPYFVLATTSPLLQAWFARLFPGVSPYRLYMLSNVGSLLALLSYPVLFEPYLALREQAVCWGIVFLLYALFYMACAARAAALSIGLPASPEGSNAGAADPPSPSAIAETPAQQAGTAEAVAVRPPAWRDRLLWVALPALASTLLLAVTNQICQELAVIPFLWILPLTLYLLSFIICFDNPRWYSRTIYLPALLLMLPVVAYVMTQPLELPMRWQIAAYVVMLFIVCMFCHGEVVARRPHPHYLTGFYLAISLGGALGGIFVGLLAPLLFRRFYELHLALLGSWLLALLTLARWRFLNRHLRPRLVAAFVILTVGPIAWHCARHVEHERPRVLLAARNFYGVFRVEDRYYNNPAEEVHSLVHGATIHGIQYVQSPLRHRPVSYYSPRSGLGMAIRRHPRRRAGLPMRIAVLGLGTGNVAIYGQRDDVVRFYEINPKIVEMAQDPRYFSYLADSPAKIEIVVGDARLMLERELREKGSQQFDILAMDAFSSDSVPAHLITKEAFEIYFRHMRQPDGIVAVHISNRFLDLRPVVYRVAEHFRQHVFHIIDPGGPGIYRSDWMLLTTSPALIRDPELREAAVKQETNLRAIRMWTDDYYNLFQILK